MIFSVNPQSQSSFTKSCALLVSPYSRSSASLPGYANSTSIRSKISTGSNLVVDNLSSGKEVQLSWAANFSKVGFSFQARERIDRGLVRNTFPRLVVRASSMPSPVPTPVGSASFYPVRGLYFFLREENRVVLWNRIGRFIAEVGTASVTIFGTLVGFTFHAQKSVVLQVLPHFFGTPGTIALIVIETAIPVSMFFYQRMQRAQEKIFMDVLSLQGIQVGKASEDEREWIDEQREIQRQEYLARPPSLFRTIVDPESLNSRPLTKYIVTLPLNFFPVAGQAAFCWLNAFDTSTALHHYYYRKLKGLSAEEEAAVIHYRRNEYQQFGMAATALNLFPGADILFVLTNAVGAALWAADIEKRMQKRKKL